MLPDKFWLFIRGMEEGKNTKFQMNISKIIPQRPQKVGLNTIPQRPNLILVCLKASVKP